MVLASNDFRASAVEKGLGVGEGGLPALLERAHTFAAVVGAEQDQQPWNQALVMRGFLPVQGAADSSAVSAS